MNLKRALPWMILLAVVGFIGWKLHTSHFVWVGFARSLRAVDQKLVVLAVLVIYSNNVLRAMRWAVFLRPALKQAGKSRIPWWSLVGSQFIGFAGLAIFGRIGELIRPLLVSRRAALPFSSQIAVVAVERVFDLGAFALIFSINLLLSPQLKTLPYLHKAGYTIAGLTLTLLVFVTAVRLAGAMVASVAGSLTGMVSKTAGAAVREKLLHFREGLNVIDSLPDLVTATGLSIALWITIAAANVLVFKAFPAPIGTLSVPQIIVLMGFGIAGSVLPIPGGSGAWAANSFALAALFHLPTELAGSAGLMVWLVGSMAVVPAGLILAKVEGISLARVADRSADVEEARA